MKNRKIVNKKEETEQQQDVDKKDNTEELTDIQDFPCDGTEKDEIISEQKTKYNELNDKYLRLYAEFDNYRKRTAKERIELSKTASAHIITSLLPVLDDFERALLAIPDDEGVKALKEGIILIYNKYKSILTKNGLEEISALGEDFNTDLHEAIANVPATNDEQKGKIIDLVEKGYFLNGVVLRFAKVVVAG